MAGDVAIVINKATAVVTVNGYTGTYDAAAHGATGGATGVDAGGAALGTSLTQGYGLPPGTEFTVQLQAALKQAGIDAVVTNAGVSGDTSAGGLARLDWSLADHPDAAILEMKDLSWAD